MELFILIISVVVLIETTIILIKNSHKNLLSSNSKRKVYVDTSTLIDGRILSVAQTGFISDDLIIPRSVIRELQLLADGKDGEKRSRARFGLDVVNELERVVHFDVTILQDELDRTPVDERLLELAKANRGVIMTNDFNLGKVAQAEGIDVLNINDLAMVLRSEYLPGDKFTLKITAEGNNPKQGVGYLPDGTMVVVDNAKAKIGKEIEVEFVRFLQTSAGKMMFAKIQDRVSDRAKGKASSSRMKQNSRRRQK